MVSNTDYVTRELASIHTKHTNNAEFSRRQLSLWADAISSHQKTTEDFISFLTELPEYRTTKLGEFRNIFFKETGQATSLEDDEAFADFMGKRRTLLEEGNIISHVRSLEASESFWRSEIDKTAKKFDVEGYDAEVEKIIQGVTQMSKVGHTHFTF
jgi:hypothetical protein